jgi:O-antigen/teichoic acid export membrane protein
VAENEPTDLRAGLTTVTVGTLFLLVATLVLVGFTFLSRVLIIRSVSSSSWTAFSLGYTVTGVLLAVGTSAFATAAARSLPYASSSLERRTIVRTTLALGGAAAAACGVGLFLAAPVLSRSLASPELGSGLGFFAIAAASLIGSTVIASIFQGFSNVTPNALIVQIISPGLFVGFLAGSYALPGHQLTYTDALVAYATACAGTLLAAVVYASLRLPAGLARGPGDRPARSRLVSLYAPLFVYGTMVSVAGSGDTLVLSAFHYAEVGTYTASLTLARLVQVGIGAASYIFLPVASGFLARGNRRAVGLTYATVTKWLALFSLPLFVVFVFLPSSSLRFVYGPSYANVVLPLQIVVTGAFLGTLLGPAAMAQVASGQTRSLAANATIAGATDVGLSLALSPHFGQVGAAVAWSVANVVYGALCLAQLAAAEHYHPFGRDFLVPLLLTSLPLALVLLLWHPVLPLLLLPVLAVAVAGLYVVVVLLTRSVDEGDRLLLGAIERLMGRQLPFVRRLARLVARPTP